MAKQQKQAARAKRVWESYLVRALRASAGTKIDNAKIVDYEGEKHAIDIELGDWRGAKIGDAAACVGARAIARTLPAWKHVVVGDHYGYGLTVDGLCQRFEHDRTVHLAQDAGSVSCRHDDDDQATTGGARLPAGPAQEEGCEAGGQGASTWQSRQRECDNGHKALGQGSIGHRRHLQSGQQ